MASHLPLASIRFQRGPAPRFSDFEIVAGLGAYIDNDGVIYFCGEYYMSGKEVWEHVPELRKMPDIRRLSACYADASIFDCTMQQSINPANSQTIRQSAKSINDLYHEQGIQLFWPFAMDRSDVGFAARLMLHWSNLDKREPTVRIVCRNRSEQPQYGLHPWDCPNLLWELMRCRREKLSAQQLLSRNINGKVPPTKNACLFRAEEWLVSAHKAARNNARQQQSQSCKALNLDTMHMAGAAALMCSRVKEPKRKNLWQKLKE